MKENVSLSEKTVLCTHIPARDYKCYIWMIHLSLVDGRFSVKIQIPNIILSLIQGVVSNVPVTYVSKNIYL